MLADQKVVDHDGQSKDVDRGVVLFALQLFRRVVGHRSAPELGLQREREGQLDAQAEVCNANVVCAQRLFIVW